MLERIQRAITAWRHAPETFTVVHPAHPPLFRLGKFQLHSGEKSYWKIDCDALTDDDWKALARLIAERYKFGGVVGVPAGGMKLAAELRHYVTQRYPVLMVVDDVLTTGGSVVETMKKVKVDDPRRPSFIYGLVIFARGELPKDVYALFKLQDNLEEPIDVA